MKERRKRNMSRTGLLFLFCLLMLCGCTQITEFMENTEVSGREVESLAAEKEEDTVLLGGMPVGIYMETDGVHGFRHGENDRYGWKGIYTCAGCGKFR